MTTYYKPVAAPVIYADLYRLCDGRLPDTFEAWRIMENTARRDLVAAGHHVIGLPVMPLDLERFCRANRCRPDSAAMAYLVARRGAEIYGTQEDYEAYRASLVVTEDVRAQRPEIVEAGPGIVRQRPWWAFWRPKYQLTDVTTAQLEADAVVRRRPGWAFWRPRYRSADLTAAQMEADAAARQQPGWAVRRRPGYAAVDAGAAPAVPMVALPRRRPWWAFWRRDTAPMPAE